jgi:rhodanese-related sulfurtransferase
MYESEESIFLDVRTNAEHIQSFIPNSILIPLNELPYKIDELERFRSKNIVVYCRVGNRSEFATKLLLDEGYRATNLLGGIAGWTGPVKP